MSCKAEMQVYNARVVPILTYGCETWMLRVKEKSCKAAGNRNEHYEGGSRSN